jgi:hypothetical protein
MKVILLKSSSKRSLLQKPGTVQITFVISERVPFRTNSRNSSSVAVTTLVITDVLCGCCRLRHTEHVQLAHLRWSDRNFDTTTQARRATSRCSRRCCVWDFSTLAYPRSLRSSIVTLLQVSTSWQQSGALCWGLHSLRSRTKSRTKR